MGGIDGAGGRVDDDGRSIEEMPLRRAALELARESPEGRALRRKIDAFEVLDATARKKAARDIREDIADIVARALTEEHHRIEMLNALTTFRNTANVAESDPVEIQDQHTLVAAAVDIAQDILVELGKEALIEALLPGAHLLLPPSDFVESLFTAMEMIEIEEDPAGSLWWS